MRNLLEQHRAYYRSGNTRDARMRVEALRKLQTTMKRRETALLRAIAADLSKAPEEAYMMELGIVYSELRYAIRHLRRWGRPRFALPSIGQLPGHGRVLRDPYGVVLILAPWNYPIQLTLVPLIAAVAAGNCAVVRPSSSAPRTAKVIAAILEESFTSGHVSAVLGESSVAAELTALPFDKIFFTGSPSVGREVMRAASANLVPVSLELGGKSPAVVAADANIKLAARRIVWGKFVNAGQTCVAPDYVLVNRKVEKQLLEAMRDEVARQYGRDPVHNPDLAAIVSDRHFARLSNMLGDGRLVCGGQTDPDTRKIAPTILTGVAEDDPLMRDEIFGPILPVITFKTMEEAMTSVRSRPHPLAFYLFTEDQDAARRVMRDMTFGGGCVNDTVLHVASNRLPFGGVGNSGMGVYHGKYGYECFSREKGIFMASTRMDVPVRYPPWQGKMKILKQIMK
ncbi:aldehyde dehydrogenase [Eubacteriales bacterium OttesenSCG-928-A19]|nr:aldehyde dehydrogenase [Eubacteriales bacterium OttesenSCG-928-A19]